VKAPLVKIDDPPTQVKQFAPPKASADGEDDAVSNPPHIR